MTITLPTLGQLALATVLVFLLLVWIIIRGSRSTHGKFSTAVFVGYRQARRRTLVGIRRVFQLDEDVIRDQTIEGLRRDQEQVVLVLQQQIAQTNRLEARVHWYEKRSPVLQKEYKAFLVHERRLIKTAREKAGEAQAPQDPKEQLLKLIRRDER